MSCKPNSIDFQIIEDDIDLLYMRLKISLNKILMLVEEDNDLKGLYDTKKHTLLECDDVGEFIKFQSTI